MAKQYTIKTSKEYIVLVDSKNIIIECNPHSNYLLFRDISSIFEEYEDRAYFTRKGEVSYPLVVEEDVLEAMRVKNDAVDCLIKKFDLRI